MLNSAKFSPIKETIYTLIDKIITYEDQIKEIETNPLYLASVSDREKNKESIMLLKQFIKNESTMASNKYSKKQLELNSLKSQLHLLELNLEKEITLYTQKDLEQELIKQKCFEKTFELHNCELVSCRENLQMLKEEKLMIEYDIVNQMSLKESYEELIKANSQLMFKNLIISYDNNNSTSTSTLISLSNTIEVEYYEMNYASISKVVTVVYDTLVEYISSLQSFDKSILVSIISNSFGNYLIDPSYDFFSDVTKKLIDSNPKLNDFIIPDTFKKLLMISIKSSALDKIISNKIDFVNKIYKPRKNELLKAINSSKEKIDKVRYKFNEVSIEVDKRRVYLNSTKARGEFIQSIKEIEQEMNMINTETKKNVFKYENQIKDLEKINRLLEEKYSSEKHKNRIEQFKKNIDEAFYQIKNTIKQSEYSDEVLERFISDLNRTTKTKGKTNVHQTKPIHTMKSFDNEKIEMNDLLLLSDNDFNIDDIEEEEKDNVGKKTTINNIEGDNNNDSNHNDDHHNADISKEATLFEFSKTIIKSNSRVNTNANCEIENNNKCIINTDNNSHLNLLNESNIQTPPKPSTYYSSSSASQVKKSISTNQSLPIPSPTLIPKLSNLYIVTECYSHLQEMNDNSNQYNPLSTPDIIPEEKCFTKSDIYLSNDNLNIIIKLQNRELKKISISLLDKTIVTGSMKKVITIVQLFTHVKNIKELLESPEIQDLSLSKEEIIKLTSNKYYHITIFLTIAIKINLLFLGYYSFKQWVNGFAYLIKNKEVILNNIN